MYQNQSFYLSLCVHSRKQILCKEICIKDNLINLKNKLISLTYFMVKIVLPVIILLLIVIFWKKIEDYFYQKFKFKINYIIVTISIIALSILGLLLYD